MPLREECLWETLTPQRPDNAALSGEVKVDVCVIGAGFTGLSAALHLLEKGKSVCVLEAHRAGHGGSGRNVGLVNAGMWIPPDEIEAGFGEAIDKDEAVWIGYADPSGVTGDRRVEPLRVAGGYLTALDLRTEAIQSFALARITGVEPA